MIDKTKFHILNFIKKEEYTGSMDGMRYMLRKKDEGMEVVIWPEPYSFGATDEALKTYRDFPLTEEGVMEAADYLNGQYSAQKRLWELSKQNL